MTTGVAIGLMVLAGGALLVALLLSVRSGKKKRPAPAPRAAAAPRRAAAPVPVTELETTRMPPVQQAAAPATASPAVATPRSQPRPAFAEPGVRGSLFHYGGKGSGWELDAPFAVVDVETTGFSPRTGDRIVEIAIARVDARGRIEDEYATLVDPGRDVGPVFVHGISNIDIRDAPRFADIAGDVLDRLDGAIVVAHNAVFEDRFLAAEFARAGIDVPTAPALCSLWLARRTMRTPNHKLRTLARYAGVSTADEHAALGDVRMVAALLPEMLALAGGPLRYPCAPAEMPLLDPGAAPKTRAPELRRTADNWLASLMARLPRAVAEARDVDAQRYLDQLTAALEDGKIIGAEATALARLAGSAGLGVDQVVSLHRRFLDAVRDLALADDILTTVELRKLRTTADVLGLPGYFDELRPTSPQDLMARQRIPAPRVGDSTQRLV
jgi:DNA polymerase-3 subunit epsilon